MPGFCYFFPARSEQDFIAAKRYTSPPDLPETARAVLDDLQHVPDDAVIRHQPKGPDGKPGVIIFPKSPAGELPVDWSYNPTHQTWQPIHPALGSPLSALSYFIGYETSKPPQPIDLERRNALAPDRRIFRGYNVTDEAGRVWSVPFAKSSSSLSALPVRYEFGADGTFHRAVHDRYAHLWQLAIDVLDLGNGVVERDEEWQVRTALTLLQTNYRISFPELSLLNSFGGAVLSGSTVGPFLMALVDNDLKQEYVTKKKPSTTATTPAGPAAGCSSASPGSTADCPATPPVLQP